MPPVVCPIAAPTGRRPLVSMPPTPGRRGVSASMSQPQSVPQALSSTARGVRSAILGSLQPSRSLLLRMHSQSHKPPSRTRPLRCGMGGGGPSGGASGTACRGTATPHHQQHSRLPSQLMSQLPGRLPSQLPSPLLSRLPPSRQRSRSATRGALIARGALYRLLNRPRSQSSQPHSSQQS